MPRSRRSVTTCWRTSTRGSEGRKMRSARPRPAAGWSRAVRADAALLLAITCLSGCAAPGTPAPPALPQHVLVITVDTLRADRLGCYGNRQVATPNMDRLARDEAHFLDILEKRGDVAVADAIAWLERRAQARTFIWVHLYDPHAPYEPPEPYASRYADHPYDGEVAWTDDLVGRLDAALARLAIRDRTLVALTSDH